MARKWRPSLGFVLGGALAGTLALSLVGLVVLRYLGPEIGFRPAAAILATGIGLATAGLGWLLVRLLLRPIRALEDYAAQVRARPRDPVDPPHHFGTQELRATADSVIDMAGTLRAREATIRNYTDHVTHEIKSPVAAIRAASELLSDGDLTAEDRALVGQIEGAAAEIQTQLDALRDAARAREPRHVGRARVAELELSHPGLRIEVEGEAELPLSPDGLRLVLRHLIDNAAAHGAGRVMVRSEELPGEVVLRVADDGPGVSEGNHARVFDAFFTTRREAGGTGMGLHILRNVVEAHGGSVTLEPGGQGDQGARFRVSFPV
ncbi:sensor histidine kinase [Aliiroseovarius sp.]|uniref:sensor histidine kinase n=1 Tax=Aliiroseovarius sp. TaxID=1872442 RepID=UPI003BA8ADCE